MAGMNYNPRNFPDPNTFLPSRWTESDEPEYISFGAGPRVCIGRKFALFEMTCFLALLLRDWKVEPLLAPKETLEGWKKRVMVDKITLAITLGSERVPLRVVRRT